MSRDDHDFNIKRGQTVRKVSDNSVWSYVEKWSNTTRTKRDDATSTTPVGDGVFTVPTDYWAFFSYGDHPFYNYRFKFGGVGTEYRAHGYASTYDPFPDWRFFGCNPNTFSPNVPLAVISEAERKALGHIAGNNWNIGQTLGELPETYGLIINTAHTLFAALNAARKGQWKKLAEVLKVQVIKQPAKTASALWLQYQYGWMPLMQEIYAACQLIESGLTGPEGFHVSSSAKRDISPPTLYSNLSGSVEGSFEHGCEVGYTFRVSNGTAYALDRLGVLDPVALAWELYPLSFVVDWFIPIGTFLESIVGPKGLEFVHGYRTTFTKVSAKAEWIPKGITQTGGSLLPTATRDITCMKRVRLLSFPMPVPTWDPQLNLSKVTSLVALFIALK
jgi:hypothetical protein